MMGFSTQSLLESILTEINIIDHYNPTESDRYKEVIRLDMKPAMLIEGYVYIGYASLLPEGFDKRGAALFVVNDCCIDFTQCNMEVLLFEGYDIEALYYKLRDFMVSKQQRYQLFENLLNTLLVDMNIKKILDFSFGFIENPIIVFGGAASIICFTSKTGISAHIPAAMDMGADGADKASFLSALKTDSIDFQHSKDPVMIEDGYCFKGRRRIAMNLIVDAERLGSVAIIEENKPLTDNDFEYLRIICRAITYKLRYSGAKQDFYVLQFEQNMIDLLNGKKINSDNNQWLNNVGADKFQNFYVAALDTAGLSKRQIADLRSLLVRRFYKSYSTLHKKDIVMLSNTKDAEDANHLRQILNDMAEQYGIEIGLSSLFSKIDQLKTYYTQATKARDFAAAAGNKRSLREYENYKIHVLLSEFSVNDLSSNVNRSLLDLIHYDKKENSEYLRTLITYIRCGKNRQKTHEILNIHKNTLIYRLERITDLLGHSLMDGDFLFDIYLSFIILDLIQKKDERTDWLE